MNTDALLSVVTVDAGRGFVVQGERERFVITAAHCLPSMPPTKSYSEPAELTYQSIIAKLGSAPSIWGECRFVDPVADIALLGPPDGQEYLEEHGAYEEFIETYSPLKINAPPQNGPAWLLSLENKWCRCTVRHNGGPLWISNAVDGILGGMSGSPILNDAGEAIGIVCTGGSVAGRLPTDGGPNPRLDSHLPGWALQNLGWRVTQ